MSELKKDPKWGIYTNYPLIGKRNESKYLHDNWNQIVEALNYLLAELGGPGQISITQVPEYLGEPTVLEETLGITDLVLVNEYRKNFFISRDNSNNILLNEYEGIEATDSGYFEIDICTDPINNTLITHVISNTHDLTTTTFADLASDINSQIDFINSATTNESEKVNYQATYNSTEVILESVQTTSISQTSGPDFSNKLDKLYFVSNGNRIEVSSFGVRLNLPTTNVIGKVIKIKDSMGESSFSPIIVRSSGQNKIEESVSGQINSDTVSGNFIIAEDFASITFVWTGLCWNVV